MIGAVDIGGTKIAVGMVDREGRTLARLDCPSSSKLGVKAGLERIVSMLQETSCQAGGKLEGIGVGCTGPVDPMEGTLGRNNFLPEWEGCPLVDELQNALGVSAVLENDADAAALGELTWGVGRGARRFLYVTVSTGIGVGMVFDGTLYRGVDGAHPELGHHVIDPNGAKCFCGAHGCWESMAGGLALAKRGNRSSAYEVCQAARQGDAIARLAVRDEAKYLGIGLANLITMYVPNVIALGGGVMQSLDLFWDTIERTINSSCGLVPYGKVHLAPAGLGKNIGLVGAACAWLRHPKES